LAPFLPADGLQAILDKIAEMAPQDRALAEHVHVTVTATAPELSGCSRARVPDPSADCKNPASAGLGSNRPTRRLLPVAGDAVGNDEAIGPDGLGDALQPDLAPVGVDLPGAAAVTPAWRPAPRRPPPPPTRPPSSQPRIHATTIRAAARPGHLTREHPAQDFRAATPRAPQPRRSPATSRSADAQEAITPPAQNHRICATRSGDRPGPPAAPIGGSCAAGHRAKLLTWMSASAAGRAAGRPSRCPVR
jgi:hypothetical protein